MRKRKVLVIEDEKDLARLLKYNFEKEGYEVLLAYDGEEGLRTARRQRPDIILLDIMLPRMDGFEVCRSLRKDCAAPVLFLTAKKSELDKIQGLKLGGDDYITKPFSIGEVLARVEAVLRRAATMVPEGAGRVGFGALAIDLERHEVLLNGKSVSLTPKEFEFLQQLIQADGKVLSRDVLMERVWGYDRSLEINTRTVDQHIARLRRKLKSEGRRIVTVTQSGYRIRMS